MDFILIIKAANLFNSFSEQFIDKIKQNHFQNVGSDESHILKKASKTFTNSKMSPNTVYNRIPVVEQIQTQN